MRSPSDGNIVISFTPDDVAMLVFELTGAMPSTRPADNWIRNPQQNAWRRWVFMLWKSRNILPEREAGLDWHDGVRRWLNTGHSIYTLPASHPRELLEDARDRQADDAEEARNAADDDWS